MCYSCCCSIRNLAIYSGFVSLVYFVSTTILVFNYLQHNVILFVLALLFGVQTVFWIKYTVGLWRVKFVKPRWHFKRLLSPMYDLISTIFGIMLSINIFQWYSQDPFVLSIIHLETPYKAVLITMAFGFIVKLVVAIFIMREHYTVVMYAIENMDVSVGTLLHSPLNSGRDIRRERLDDEDPSAPPEYSPDYIDSSE